MRVSVEQALKGKPKEEIDQALRRADLDVLFLFFLHQQANGRLAERERYFATLSLMLTTGLSALVREHIHNDRAQWNRLMVGLNMPYPLDPETAAAVDAAIQNHLITWEALEESDEVAGWVTDSFVAEGKTELPSGVYRPQLDYFGPFTPPDREEVRVLFHDQESFDQFLAGEDYSNCLATPQLDYFGPFTPPDREEVRVLFHDPQESFDQFLAGEDYSNCLADVTDEEFIEHYETIVSSMKDLDLDGLVVELPTVPHRFLRDASLIEGEWIDRYMVEVAEWSARLSQQVWWQRSPTTPIPWPGSK